MENRLSVILKFWLLAAFSLTITVGLINQHNRYQIELMIFCLLISIFLMLIFIWTRKIRRRNK